MKFYLLLIVLFAAEIFGQRITIKKVLDSNLFELDDGRIVKLAGVDTPMLSHQEPFFQSAARDAVEYSKLNYLNKLVVVESLSKPANKNFEIVIMYRKYFLGNDNINKKFLLYGFGKYFDNIGEIPKEEFLEYQQSAIENKRGIWQYNGLIESDTLDVYLLPNSENIIKDYPDIPSKIIRETNLALQIPLEIVVGTGFTLITGFASAVIVHSLDKTKGEYSGLAAILYGSIIGYTLGFPIGVYLAASPYNENLSLPITILSSVGLTASLYGVRHLMNPSREYNWADTFVAFAPIIGSLFYTHVVAPKENPSLKQLTTHKDFYNSTQILNYTLFRISF